MYCLLPANGGVVLHLMPSPEDVAKGVLRTYILFTPTSLDIWSSSSFAPPSPTHVRWRWLHRISLVAYDTPIPTWALQTLTEHYPQREPKECVKSPQSLTRARPCKIKKKKEKRKTWWGHKHVMGNDCSPKQNKDGSNFKALSHLKFWLKLYRIEPTSWILIWSPFKGSVK